MPALGLGVSLAYESAPSSLSFAGATASVGGFGVAFGPVGLAIGVVTGLGFLGYQLFKSQDKKQNSFYIERAGESPGEQDPKNSKGHEGKKTTPPPPPSFDNKKKNEKQQQISRRKAFNEAKDRANIPRSQQPSRQWQVGDDANVAGQNNYRYSRDPATHGRYYEYDTPHGKRVIVEHTNDGVLHMHAGKPKPGADQINYDFKENRYQKIIGSDGDHHIYYAD